MTVKVKGFPAHPPEESRRVACVCPEENMHVTHVLWMSGEELEFEYEDKSHGSWLCRIK